MGTRGDVLPSLFLGSVLALCLRTRARAAMSVGGWLVSCRVCFTCVHLLFFVFVVPWGRLGLVWCSLVALWWLSVRSLVVAAVGGGCVQGGRRRGGGGGGQSRGSGPLRATALSQSRPPDAIVFTHIAVLHRLRPCVDCFGSAIRPTGGDSVGSVRMAQKPLKLFNKCICGGRAIN